MPMIEATVENKYRAFALHNFRSIPQMALLSEEQLFDIEVVGNVLPFKVNNYVLDELIDWTNYEDDPIYRLTFPHRDMLKPEHYELMANTLRKTSNKMEIKHVANKIRLTLNPHPAGQLELNVPEIDGVKLTGVQHKYRETVLFFSKFRANLSQLLHLLLPLAAVHRNGRVEVCHAGNRTPPAIPRTAPGGH